MVERPSKDEVRLSLVADWHTADDGTPDCYGTRLSVTLGLVREKRACRLGEARVRAQDYQLCGADYPPALPATDEPFREDGPASDLARTRLRRLTLRSPDRSRALVLTPRGYWWFDGVEPGSELRLRVRTPGDVDAGCCFGATASWVHFPDRRTGEAPLPVEERDAPPITPRNWRDHPRVAAARAEAELAEAEVAAGRWASETRTLCPAPAVEERREAWRDAAGLRRLVRSTGSYNGAAYLLEQHYDERGRLRVVHALADGPEGSRLEHRVYFGADRTVLWWDRQQAGSAFPFPEGWPERAFARSPALAWEAAPGCR
jgi:hypothetical protein